LDEEINTVNVEYATKNKKIDYNKKSLNEQQQKQREMISKMKQHEQNYVNQFNQDLKQGFTKDQMDKFRKLKYQKENQNYLLNQMREKQEQ
jgi:hypothetical protein